VPAGAIRRTLSSVQILGAGGDFTGACVIAVCAWATEPGATVSSPITTNAIVIPSLRCRKIFTSILRSGPKRLERRHPKRQKCTPFGGLARKFLRAPLND